MFLALLVILLRITGRHSSPQVCRLQTVIQHQQADNRQSCRSRLVEYSLIVELADVTDELNISHFNSGGA